MNNTARHTAEKPFCLLICDDNEGDIRLFCEAVTGTGLPANVIQYRSVDSALTHLIGLTIAGLTDPIFPDIIVLGINRPGAAGVELLSAVKKHPLLCHIPVIILSTSTRPEDINRCYTQYANSYLVKPPGYEEFAAMVTSLVNYWMTMATLPNENRMSY